ncbi:MAG: hypothetical protein LQ352_000889 [Teloschistes flavicans]|nr:MAG: hypothetical protein LQ352_000889 [Teloschistes flavicans]
MSKWFNKSTRGTPDSGKLEGSRRFRNSETDLREQREEDKERERLRASGVPEWVIGRRLADSRQELEKVELELERAESGEITRRLQRIGPLSPHAEECLRSTEECRLWARDVRWAKAGMTRWQIVQLKREGWLGIGTQLAEGERRAQALRSPESREALTRLATRRTRLEDPGSLEEGDGLPPYS